MRRARARVAALALLVLVFGFAIVAVVVSRELLDASLPVADTKVIVPSGSSARDIGTLLAQRGVVRSALAFDVLARVERKGAVMKAGEFLFPAHTALAGVLREVTGVGRQVAIWVTVPEGFTAKQIAQTLAEHDLGSYDAFAARFLSARLDVDGTTVTSLEGYLFPDTYLIPEAASPATVAAIMTGKFFGEIPADARSLAQAHGLTVPQVVTLASLVEREAKSDDERALMAGVYYNRLKLGMPLQVDATIEYTFAHHKDVITYADLARDTPYNTYKYAGLPPTPIANPGRPSLAAAFHPQASNFLYYVYKGNGHHVFARTLAEHQANVARYLH